MTQHEWLIDAFNNRHKNHTRLEVAPYGAGRPEFVGEVTDIEDAGNGRVRIWTTHSEKGTVFDSVTLRPVKQIRGKEKQLCARISGVLVGKNMPDIRKAVAPVTMTKTQEMLSLTKSDSLGLIRKAAAVPRALQPKPVVKPGWHEMVQTEGRYRGLGYCNDPSLTV